MRDVILVLGTTYNQVPLIKKIQSMGMDAWATSNGDSSSCDGIADRILKIDTTDSDALLKVVGENPIKGLVTCGTSTAICTIALINERLGLSQRAIPYDVAVNATLKDNFRRILAPEGLVPRGENVSTPDEVFLKSRELAFPIVLKPVDAGGGKGVEVVLEHSTALLGEAYDRSIAFSPSRRLIVEEYITGIPLGVESITLDGVTHVLAVAEKTLAGFPHCVTTGVFFPSSRLEEHVEKIVEVNGAAIARLGIEWGPTHIDMLLREDGTPFIVDIGPRLAGGPIASTLIESATGYDLYRAAIDLCAGRDVDAPHLSPTPSVQGSHFIVRDLSGTISKLEYDVDLARDLDLHGFRLLKRVGDRVDGIKTDGDRLAVFHLSAPSRAAMEERILKMDRAVTVEVS